MDKSYVGAWSIPILNIAASIIMLVGLIIHWYQHGSKNRLTRWFLGEKWSPTVINPVDEQRLDNMNIKTIEQYLRKKKLKKLK